MSFMEWIFGWSHEEALERARQKVLSKAQEAVDTFHGEMLHICGYRKNECGDCWNEIPEGSEHLYDRCPNYQKRCEARNKMNVKYEMAMKEFYRDLDKAYVNSFNFLMRPLMWCYVACGGLEKSRERMKKMMESASKCMIIAVLTCAFLAGPVMLVDADARRGWFRGAARMFSRQTVVVKPPRMSTGSVILGSAAGAAAGTVVGEAVYDALKPDEEQNQVPVNEQPQMQSKERPFNAGRGDCGCQGN